MEDLQGLGDFLYSWLIAMRNYLLAIPESVLIFGLIMGFLCAATGWQKNRIKVTGVLFKACNTSSIIAVALCLFMAGYILCNQGALNLFYYACAVVLGVLICKLFHVAFAALGIVGNYLDVTLTLASGPLAVVVSWFFHIGVLVKNFNKIFWWLE